MLNMYQRSRIIRPREVPPIDIQSLGTEVKIYGEISDPVYRHMNPSIAWHDGELKIAIRSCNFMVERHGKWSFRDGSVYSKTDVLYGNVDPDTLQVSRLIKLELSPDSPTRTLVAGIEDVRLYQRGKDMHAIGFESDRLTKSLHNESASLAEYIIKDKQLKYIRTLKKPEPKAVEKNWCPPDLASKEFDFTYTPTQVWKDDKLIGMPYQGIIHGGSQLLKQKDGTYLSLVHDKVLDRLHNRPGVYDKYIYRHYLARHGKDGIITHLTKPFTFGTHENIEFAAGMVEHDGHFLISFGIRDCRWAICKISKGKLVDLLEPVDK